MFAAERQNKLNQVLTAIRSLPGVESVEQDDFDSCSINVFVTLKPAIVFPLRSVKAGTRRACEPYGCKVLDFPKKKYSYGPPIFGIRGDRYDEGYDINYLKVEVYV